MFGAAAQLVCNIIAVAYPAFISLKALETSSKDDDTKWLTYWVLYAIFSVFEFFTGYLPVIIPFYYLWKVNYSGFFFLLFIRTTFDFDTKSIDRMKFIQLIDWLISPSFSFSAVHLVCVVHVSNLKQWRKCHLSPSRSAILFKTPECSWRSPWQDCRQG